MTRMAGAVAALALLATACIATPAAPPEPACSATMTHPAPGALHITVDSTMPPDRWVKAELFANGHREFSEWFQTTSRGRIEFDVPIVEAPWSVYWVGRLEDETGTLCEASLTTPPS